MPAYVAAHRLCFELRKRSAAYISSVAFRALGFYESRGSRFAHTIMLVMGVDIVIHINFLERYVSMICASVK